jgi:hypothetical protein
MWVGVGPVLLPMWQMFRWYREVRYRHKGTTLQR